MRLTQIIKTLTAGLVLAIGLFVALPGDTDVLAASTKVMWGKTELKAGQTGKVTILKATPLVKINSKGGLTTVRMLKKGEEYRTYQYKAQNGGLYGVGSVGFVQKNASAVKYATPSKEKLALVNKGKVTAPVVKPVVAGTEQYKKLDDLKKIAKDLYNNKQFQPKNVEFFTTTDLNSQFVNYSFLSNDISQDIQGYTFYGRTVHMDTSKVSNGVYKNVMYVVNDRYQEDETVWNKKMDNAEKFIVANYTLNTEYDVVVALVDFVTGQMEYGGDFAEDHPYLEWRQNMNTCTGYSDMMADLLNRFGIESRLATGDAHAWNAVKVGGNWYYTDATFTDTAQEPTKFLMMTNSQRMETLNNPIETNFKVSDVPFDVSTAKPYTYKK